MKRPWYSSKQRFRPFCHGLAALAALVLFAPVMAGDQTPFEGTFTDEFEQHAVLGGTGRFEGETGSFTVMRNPSTATIEGTKSSPSSNK